MPPEQQQALIDPDAHLVTDRASDCSSDSGTDKVADREPDTDSGQLRHWRSMYQFRQRAHGGVRELL